ncbi:hypothetical protein B4135_1937 [Caldibacillus debilis]|jgi:hypothetical protein|uniref:Uncharacterized protein n=1 Tax=Caldibacillus debilis TaxID=301148 RepID=A0A150M7H5_9BACI|nr:hypothetical protein B4135_1937 [Caldibacillus debilis]
MNFPVIGRRGLPRLFAAGPSSVFINREIEKIPLARSVPAGVFPERPALHSPAEEK